MPDEAARELAASGQPVRSDTRNERRPDRTAARRLALGIAGRQGML